MNVYMVARHYLDGDNYELVDYDTDEIFATRERAQERADEANRPGLERMTRDNATAIKDRDTRQKELDVLAAAGLREHRVLPPAPQRSRPDEWYDVEEFEVIE